MHGGGDPGAQGFTRPDVFAQHVARRYVRHLQAILKQIGLRAFSRTWGPKQNYSLHHGKLLCR
jgi:N-acetylmuramoyl-L-alanine amidase